MLTKTKTLHKAMLITHKSSNIFRNNKGLTNTFNLIVCYTKKFTRFKQINNDAEIVWKIKK